ncbi:unnamed protein product [Phytophthora fragariaefolia]|uniref:Unnamed protein product n=1 Tax=Phytophthora fragariaefolia TaxID=1490495 RepID=A0A9W6YAT2_9STRA|nr:unnamed protein product [Phytophthora fragariaefolia]
MPTEDAPQIESCIVEELENCNLVDGEFGSDDDIENESDSDDEKVATDNQTKAARSSSRCFAFARRRIRRFARCSSSAMAVDHELATVCKFLNELSLDEIYRLELDEIYRLELGAAAGSTPDDSVCSGDGDDDETDASTVAGVTSDEGSDVEDAPKPGATSSKKRTAGQSELVESPTKKKRAPKSELQRARQRVYDQKCRLKKHTSHKAACQAFVPALKLFVLLMQKRLEQTQMKVQMLCIVKRDGDGDARAQEHQNLLKMNRDAVALIDRWTSDWSTERSKETGKFFMREQAKDIELGMADLVNIRKQLNVATAELEWRTGGHATVRL